MLGIDASLILDKTKKVLLHYKQIEATEVVTIQVLNLSTWCIEYFLLISVNFKVLHSFTLQH